MKPSHVRARILKDHAALRRHLIELEEATEAMLVDGARISKVSELATQLIADLVRHTELEDTILAPALMELDAWGQIRAEQLLLHHQHQRAYMVELSDLFDLEARPLQIARATYTLIADLRADMEHEERDMLSADLLRDDVIAVAAECS